MTTKRKPAGVGKILIEEFMEPMGLTQSALAEAMGVQRKHVNELRNDRRNMSEPQSHRKRRFHRKRILACSKAGSASESSRNRRPSLRAY